MFFSSDRTGALGPRLLRLACVALLLFTPVMMALAQSGIDTTGTGGRHKIQGRIYFPSGRRSDAASIRVVLESTSSERLSVIADLNGGFAFNSIAPGSYTLTVDAGADYETARESIYVEGSGVRSRTLINSGAARADVARTFSVLINLRLKQNSPAAMRPATINAALSSAPKPAVELYDKAIESVRAGDSKKAAELLRDAIKYYPEFTIALNELGVQYLRLGEPDKAVEAFRSALKIRPDDFIPRLNYGIALLEKKDAVEAEAQFRQAIQKNDSSWAAHMYLGVTLINLRRYDEAETAFLRALSVGGDKLSLPHYYLGGIYWRRREYKRAADELEKYLQLSPKAPEAERIRLTIKDLRSKSSSG
jgi:tetratricopeptide (TPR) repeat protein